MSMDWLCTQDSVIILRTSSSSLDREYLTCNVGGKKIIMDLLLHPFEHIFAAVLNGSKELCGCFV